MASSTLGHLTGDEGGMEGRTKTRGHAGLSVSPVGKLESFNLDNRSIAVFLEHMELYLSANNVLESKQVPVFLNVTGRSTYT